MVKIWGITGPIGSGKSQVLGILKDFGFEVLDADQCVSRLWSHPPEALRVQLMKDFGSTDKDQIRCIVADQPQTRLQLESLLHPFVYQELARWLVSVQGSVVFVEGTRWSQGPTVEGWQGVLFVDASEALRRQRVQARNPTTADFLWALSNRLPWDEYRKSATFRLVNDTGLTELKAQVEKWLQDQGIKIPRVEPEAPSR